MRKRRSDFGVAKKNNGLCTWPKGCTEARSGNGRQLCKFHYAQKVREYNHTPHGRTMQRNRSLRYYAGAGRHKVRELKYGLNKEEVEALLEIQGGCCAICRTTDPGGPWKEWSVDHDHKENKARGLLCVHCNHGLGSFKDDPALLKSAVAYLRRTSAARSPVYRAIALARSRRNDRVGNLPRSRSRAGRSVGD